MARGQRRWQKSRLNIDKNTKRQPVSRAGRPSAPSLRSLALNAFALTGAVVSALAPAHAVTLGELSVESRLGQPLSARIPVQLQPGESLGAGCVSVPAVTRAELGQVPGAMVMSPETSAAGIYDLRVTTTQALYEPMYELQLQVRCPGTALVVRQYVLMLDLPGTSTAAAAPVSAAAPAAASLPVSPVATPEPAAMAQPRPVRPRPRVMPAAPIEHGTAYRVVAGDTLSTIAARVSGRGSQGIWKMADQIFAANPDAFIGANPDLIKLGSEIIIPAPDSGAVAALAPAPDAPAAPVTAEPAPVTPAAAPVPDMPVATVPDDITPAVTAAVAETTPAAVFQDERVAVQQVPVPAPVDAAPAAMKPVETTAPVDSGTPAWMAALVGVLIGATASIALLRDRLWAALRALAQARKPVIAPLAAAADATAAPVPRFTKPLVAREPSMLVVEEHHAQRQEEPAAATDPTDETPALTKAARDSATLDSDLSRLFGAEASSTLPPGDEEQHGLADLDLDLSAATPDGPVDEDIGWIGDDTALSPTVDISAQVGPTGDTVEHIDLQTLSNRAVDDAQVSQTLRDALNLLESDYEEELTASQVIDQKKLQKILDDDAAEDTMVRTGTDQFPRR